MILVILLTRMVNVWIVWRHYYLTKISIRAKRSISCVFSLFIVPSPFFVQRPY